MSTKVSNGVHQEDSKAALASTCHGDKKCTHCGREGHLKTECFHNPESKIYRPKRHLRQRQNTGDSSNNQNRTYQDQVGTGYITFIVKSLTTKPDSASSLEEKRFMDSEATSHMSNKACYFLSLDKEKGVPPVSIGDGNSTAVSGVGTILENIIFDNTTKHVEMQEAL